MVEYSQGADTIDAEQALGLAQCAVGVQIPLVAVALKP
jgi:hypothetical protein